MTNLIFFLFSVTYKLHNPASLHVISSASQALGFPRISTCCVGRFEISLAAFDTVFFVGFSGFDFLSAATTPWGATDHADGLRSILLTTSVESALLSFDVGMLFLSVTDRGRTA